MKTSHSKNIQDLLKIFLKEDQSMLTIAFVRHHNYSLSESKGNWISASAFALIKKPNNETKVVNVTDHINQIGWHSIRQTKFLKIRYIPSVDTEQSAFKKFFKNIEQKIENYARNNDILIKTDFILLSKLT